MNTQTLILAILNFNDASGYEIKKFSIEGSFSHFVDISYGSIYPTLSRLEQEELVTCRSESQDGKPDKKVYSITDKGKMAFVESLAAAPKQDTFKSEFLLLAMNADLTQASVMETAISNRIADLEEKLEMIRTARAGCDRAATQWVTAYAEHMKNADLQFLKQNRASLMALANDAGAFTEAAE